MKKAIMAVITLVILGICCVNDISYGAVAPLVYWDEDGNAFTIKDGIVYSLTEDEAISMEKRIKDYMNGIKEAHNKLADARESNASYSRGHEDDFKLEYVKADGAWLKVGIKSEKAGWVTCRAIKDGQTIAIKKNHTNGGYSEILIRNAASADYASCSISNNF